MKSYMLNDGMGYKSVSHVQGDVRGDRHSDGRGGGGVRSVSNVQGDCTGMTVVNHVQR